MYKLKYYIVLVLVSLFVPFISTSEGDRSPFYQKCVQKCKNSNCTSDGGFTAESAKVQEVWDSLLQWNCEDDCRYHCMWRTVLGFKERGFEIPKFHGKWPFTRILGVQEPASAFSSILNLVVNVYMYMKVRREFSMKDTPMIIVWHCFAWVCINSWVWSTVFHTRDKFFTEFMDYACALSMVMGLLMAGIARIFYSRRWIIGAILMFSLMVYYVEHVLYLYTGQIDYEYNMQVNIFFGVLGSVVWMLWSWKYYTLGRRYVLQLVAFTLLSGVLLTMELFDFPPRYGWDAHALWHLTTAQLPVLFYRFVISDLRHLQRVTTELKLP